MLRKKVEDANKALEELRAKDADFEKREAELEASINEAETDEEKAVVEGEVEKFDEEKKAHEDEKAELEKTVSELEAELDEVEAEPAPTPAPKEDDEEEKGAERGKKINMETRTKFFGMNAQERDAFLANDEVKACLERVRDFGRQERAVTGADLTIPDVMLGLIRENVENYSKLIKHVNLRRVSGKARANILGTIPEGVWTEMCAKINELSIGFNNVEVDGFKVAGYIGICNATLEDSDLNLAREIMTAIAQALGYALDKAIVFGTNVKMPMGFFTRLAQTSEPADYPDTYRTWVDLHTSNIKTIADTAKGVDLFKALVVNSGAAKGKYSRGTKTWVMNEATYTTLVAEAMSINASGAVVTGMNKVMPVIGGTIEILDFIPDNMIFGGYLDLYLLAERAGMKLAKSTEFKFLDDVTVFKGTARYDGEPAIAEGFVAIGINGTTPSASGISFAEDVVNP